MRRGMFGALLVAFVVYAARFAPPDDPQLTRALIRGAFSGDFGSVDPGVAAVFSMLGVVPLLFLAFLVRDGAQERVPAWPFALAAFAVGGFAILPYLVLRSGGAHRTPAAPGRIRRALGSRAFGVLLLALLALLAIGGVVRGHASAFAHAFRTTSMVNVMSLDLVLCSFLLVYMAAEIARRDADLRETPLLRAVRLVPLFGPFVWNCVVRRSA